MPMPARLREPLHGLDTATPRSGRAAASMTCAPVDHFAIGFDIRSEMIEPVKPTTAENSEQLRVVEPGRRIARLVEPEHLQDDPTARRAPRGSSRGTGRCVSWQASGGVGVERHLSAAGVRRTRRRVRRAARCSAGPPSSQRIDAVTTLAPGSLSVTVRLNTGRAGRVVGADRRRSSRARSNWKRASARRRRERRLDERA